MLLIYYGEKHISVSSVTKTSRRCKNRISIASLFFKIICALFKLNNKGNVYSDVTSLKDARFAITGDFLAKKNNPLWTLKYASPSAFAGLPIAATISDSIKNLIDNIVQICMERELRNPALVNQTLALIEEQRIEMKNILNVEEAFNDGFKNFLMQIEFVNVQEHEIGEVRDYIAGHLESTVGYWTEDEVIKSVKEGSFSLVSGKVEIPHQEAYLSGKFSKLYQLL